MIVPNLPAVTRYLAAWSEHWHANPGEYTPSVRLRTLDDVANDLCLDPRQTRELIDRATPRIAFAPPALYALRVLQSLAEVLR